MSFEFDNKYDLKLKMLLEKIESLSEKARIQKLSEIERVKGILLSYSLHTDINNVITFDNSEEENFRRISEEFKKLRDLKGTDRSKLDDYLYHDLIIRIYATYKLYIQKYKADKNEVSRSKYNYCCNTNLMSLLNYIINDYDKNNEFIKQNTDVLKLNVSQFVIHYYFEKIRDELLEVMKESEEKIEVKMNELLSKYNNNTEVIQLMYEVLLQNFSEPFMDKHQKSNSPKIGSWLKNHGAIGDFRTTPQESLFIFLRNCASHGEFYPDIDKKIVSAQNTKRMGSLVIQKNLSFDDIQSLGTKLVNVFDDSNMEFFKKILLSSELESLKKEMITQYDETTIAKNFSIILMFNLIQYNDEQYFKKIYSENELKGNLERLHLKDYFTSSFDPNSKNTGEYLDIIKNAIGHFNIEFDGETVTFSNIYKGITNSVSASLERLYSFFMSSNIIELSNSTRYRLKLRREIKKLEDALYDNKQIYNHYVDYISEYDYKIDNNKENFSSFYNKNNFKL